MPQERNITVILVAAVVLLGSACSEQGQIQDQSAQPASSAAQERTLGEADRASIWIEHVQAWSTLGAAVVAAAGLTGVFVTLRRGRRQQRIECGPYIRVDVAPTSGGTSDFDAPKPHFVSDADVFDLAPNLSNAEKVSLSAWLTNFQPHRLGSAFRVAAFFVLEARSPGSLIPIYRYSIVRVAYIENQRSIKIELFKIPQDWTAALWLSHLAFSDFYDEYHEHSEGRNENALHGRLTCTYKNGVFSSIPEARPAARWRVQRLTSVVHDIIASEERG